MYVCTLLGYANIYMDVCNFNGLFPYSEIRQSSALCVHKVRYPMIQTYVCSYIAVFMLLHTYVHMWRDYPHICTYILHMD